MQVVEYTQEHEQRLSATLERARTGALLRHRPYVRHFYLGNPACRLYLLLSPDGEIAATLGSEMVPFRMGNRSYRTVIASHTYSLRPGALGLLFVHWMRLGELCAVIPMTARWSAMLEAQPRWKRIPGFRTYYLNWGYPEFDSDPWWKRRLKPIVRLLRRVDAQTFPARIAKITRGSLAVVEETAVSDDMLHRNGAFDARLDPDAAYLNWRFATTLDYVRYRVFRIVRDAATRGYVVMAEWPNCVIVAHCDGDDAQELALGVLLAVSSSNGQRHRYRKVLLATMHAEMASIFHRFGFRPKPGDTPFYLGTLRTDGPEIRPTGRWLLNMDWGDFGQIVGVDTR